MQQPRLHGYADSTSLADDLAPRIAVLANSCIESHGCFTMVLAGGTTPRQLYTRLPQIATDWRRWQLYFGDERCLPRGHPDRNDTMAAAAWLDHVAIPADQIHRVPARDNAVAAAAAYSAVLTPAPRFDLVILGLGEDGHTASLFPGTSQSEKTARTTPALAITDAPKPPAQRVSMSPQRLSDAGAVWFLVTGEAKRPALDAWLAGAELPPRHIVPATGVDIFTDLDDPLSARKLTR